MDAVSGPETDKVREVLAARLAADGASWQERLDALEELGRLGDPRLPDPRTLTAFTPETGWVRVEKGSYAVGGDKETSGSLRKQKSKTPGFYIRTWQVTVQEFAPFVEHGWNEPGYWTEGRGEEGAEPGDWSEQQRRPNCPVVSVSWYAARAFCRWAQAAWRLPMAGVLDLPTSREWEIAARRGTGRVYPWGDAAPGKEDTARAAYNWTETHNGGPFGARGGCAPVGAFPPGHTPERGEAGPLWDMGGNVWEWCASLWEERKDVDVFHPIDDKPFVLRGGAWILSAGGLRAADRSWGRPGVRFGYIGFRLVVRLPGLLSCE